MRTISDPRVGRTSAALSWSSRITRLKRVFGGTLIFALLYTPVPTVRAMLPNPYSVTLAWEGSADADVTGYRVYYGTASGSYSNSIAMGNVTTGTVPSLTGGFTYFFAVTAYTAIGLESDFSNEVSCKLGVSEVQIRSAPAGQVVVAVSGLAGHTYEILATETFTAWTVIGTVTLGADGWLEFTDTNAAMFSKRFYRTHDTGL